MSRHVVPPTAIPAVWDLDSGGGFSSPLALPRGALVEEAEGSAAGSESKPVGMVGGGPSCADVSVGSSSSGLSVGSSVSSSVGTAVSEAGSSVDCVASGDCEEASVAVTVASVEVGTGDCSPLVALVTAGALVLSEVGTGAIGTCDSTESTSTALVVALEEMTVSVGCAIEAEVVAPVGMPAADVIDTPRSEVGTREVAVGASEDVSGIITEVSLVGTRVEIDASGVTSVVAGPSVAALVKPVTEVSLVGTMVVSNVPEGKIGTSVPDVSLTGADVTIPEVSLTDVAGMSVSDSVGVGLT